MALREAWVESPILELAPSHTDGSQAASLCWFRSLHAVRGPPKALEGPMLSFLSGDQGGPREGG